MARILRLCFCAGFAGAMLAGAMQAASTDERINLDGPEITAAVEDALLFDSAVPSNDIRVRTDDGIVTLSGSVNNLLAKERATKAASQIRGVRSVVNQINVMPFGRSDAEIRRDVKDALIYDAATDGFELAVSVEDGVATLSGTVQSWQEQELALHVAKGVRGVRDVADNITVDYQTDRSDAEIEADVRRTLETDPWAGAASVRVSVSDGTVMLSGPVASLAEKQRVISDAWVAGVQSVEADGLTVEPWLDRAVPERSLEAVGAEFDQKSDEEIAAAVRDALLFDPRVMAFEPNVAVRDGIVTLTGTVDNLRARQAAERDARNTRGVRGVVNHLKVRDSGDRSDDELAASVNEALARNPITESYEIEVTADSGVISLSGTVNSFLEKSEAEKVAQSATGVTEVLNELEVRFPAQTYYSYGHDPLWDYNPYYVAPNYAARQPPVGSTWPYSSDAEVKDDIEDEFFWSPFVDSDDITVSVNNGIATLTGTVDDWSEFDSATENAYEGGARYVVNNLNIL